MIQINNTNSPQTLNLKLEDSIELSTELVQNGNFNEIDTTNLVLNPDFAEIGSDLVTNGDFSDVPLGSELVDCGDFSCAVPLDYWNEGTGWQISGGTANKTGSVASNFFQYNVFTSGKSYKVTFDVSNSNNGRLLVYMGGNSVTEDITNASNVTYTFYGVADGSHMVFRNVNFTGSIDNVSVKEQINLVSNPNFTDGVELLTQPIDLTVDFIPNGSGVIDDSNSFTTTGAAFDGLRNKSSAFQLIDGKSYKLVIEGTTTSSGFTIGSVTANGNEYGTGFGTHYFVATTANPTTLWIRQQTAGTTDLTTFTIEELGADWTVINSGTAATYFGENKVQLVTSGDFTNVVQLQTIDLGKSYKYSFEIVDFFNGSAIFQIGGATVATETGNGVYSGYYTSLTGDDHFEFKRSGATDLGITNVSVQELGADWASQDGDIETYNENGVTITSINTDQFNRLRQDLVTEDGKSYKVTYTIHETSYTAGTILEYYDGVFYRALPEQGVGTHTFYFTRVGTNDNWYFNFDAHISGSLTDFVTISSISVQEVGQDWSVANSDSTQYVEFFGGVGGARIVVADAATSPILTLTANGVTLLAGKSYKLVVDVTVVSGSVKYDVTGTTILFNTTEVKTAYFSPVSDVGLSFYRASSNVDVTFNSVIVQQLDTNNDWNLNTNWVLTDNGALSNGTSNSDINQSKWFPKLGETYKIEYTISLITQGAYKITLGGETTPARDTAGTYIEYVTAIDLSDGGGRLRIRMDNNAIGTISSISVYDIDGLLDIEFTNQLTSKKFDFPNIPVVTTNGRYSSISITPPAETSPPSNATMDEGMYLVTFKLDQLDKVLATRLAFVGSLPAFKEATYDAYKVTDGTAYNVYING